MSSQDPPDPLHPPGVWRYPDWAVISGCRVSRGGRVTIYQDARERYGIGEGDVFDAVFLVRTGHDPVIIPDAEVQGQFRINIPQDRVERHDLTGETVDVLLHDPDYHVLPDPGEE